MGRSVVAIQARGQGVTAVATSADGIAWEWHGTMLEPQPGRWDAPVSVARYLDILRLPGGGYRIYYEWPGPGQAHELRTELIAT